MTTAREPGDPFAESAGEAVQAAVMATRLVLAIADAVRRHQQNKHKGTADELPPADRAVSETAENVKALIPSTISAALMGQADWPQMAQQLMALRDAGVDLGQILPRVGEIAVSVQEQVAANAERVAREHTGEWERMLRETLPAGPVREAILSSPKWPDIAATMARLDERGVDVRKILASAHEAGDGVDKALAEVMRADAVPAVSDGARLSYGPLTTGLSIPRDLDLSNRERALRQLSISPLENSAYARWVREAMVGRERDAALLVNHSQWPLVAARMAQMESAGKPVREHLAQLGKVVSWEKGPGPELGSRLVQAANDALLAPVGGAVTGSRVKVNTTAARSASATVDPTKAQAKSGAPTEAGVAPHRQAGAAPAKGKTK